MKKRPLAVTAAGAVMLLAACGGSAHGDGSSASGLSADAAVCEDVLDWNGAVDDVREMAQVVTADFIETFSVMSDRAVEATSKMGDRSQDSQLDSGFRSAEGALVELTNAARAGNGQADLLVAGRDVLETQAEVLGRCVVLFPEAS